MVFCFVSCCFVNCYLIDCTGLLDKKRMIILLLLVIAALLSSGNPIPDDHLVSNCHATRIPECAEFNHTTIPGLDYDDISDTFNDIDRLFHSECSAYIQYLVCFMLEPTCHEHLYTNNVTNERIYHRFIGHVCMEFCYAVQQECQLYAAYWTSALNCSELPLKSSMMCFTPDGYNETDDNTTSHNTTTAPTTVNTTTTNADTTTTTTNADTIPTTTPTADSDNNDATKTPVRTCPGQLVVYQGASYGGIDNCAAPCHYLYEEDRYSSGLVTFLFALWSVLSLLAFISFLSFLLTWKHYSHIEHPYHFLALCHSPMFLAFLIRLGSGHDGMVCDTRHNNINNTALITEDGSNAACTAVFIIVYYCIVAIGTWLVNLSIALCTRTLYKWKNYLLVGYHLSGWGIPLIFVITACILKMMSGDSLLGMCQLDNQYLIMLLVPTMACVGLSFILLLFAVMQMLFCSQVCVEVQHKHPGRFLRSLIFGVFVLIEISVVAVLYLIEYVMYNYWETSYVECEASPTPEPDCSTRTFSRPSYAIPILRYSLISAVGAVSIVWPLVRRVTWKSWKDSIYLLYRKVVNSFSVCSWRSKSAVIVQLVS